MYLPKIHELYKQGFADQANDLLNTYAVLDVGPIERAQMGVYSVDLGRWHLAIHLLEGALSELDGSNYWQALTELAGAKFSIGHFAAARGHYLRARSPQPYSPWFLLAGGNEDDLGDYRNRFVGDGSVAGSSVYIMGEGGVGDLFWLSRYATQLKADGASFVGFQAHPAAQGLLARHPDIDLAIPYGLFDQPWDAVMGLFTLFPRYQAEPICSAPLPYLTAPSIKQPPFLENFKQRGTRPRVGLSWRSASSARHEPYRSSSLVALAPLVAASTCDWVCIQTDITEDELALAKRLGMSSIGPLLTDYDQTAASLSHIDLLISIDSSIGHLAGALGVPCWLMLSAACDYRWLDSRALTPWYPRHQLFRQAKLGEWGDVVVDLQLAISRF